MRVALLFIDGVGIGSRDPDRNPLAREELLLSQFEDGTGAPLGPEGHFQAVDTTFGVPGRPQSASNQTALYTGLPAPQLLGRHVLGFPNQALRALLAEHSLARALTAAGRKVTFANGYPAAYLDALGFSRRHSRGPDLVLPASDRRRVRPSASVLAMTAGEVELRTFDDVRAGVALTHDIDGSAAARRHLGLPVRSTEEAAEIFWSIASDFTLFEYFLADEAGHARDWEKALRALRTFDAFARALVQRRPSDATVLICSDHGNVEDLSLRGHTRNRVSALCFGPVRPLLTDVSEVGRAVGTLLGLDQRDHPQLGGMTPRRFSVQT